MTGGFLCGAVGIALLAFGQAAIAQTRLLEYEVKHPVLGDIGTYTNLVRQDGDATTVTSRLHVVARLLGVVMHREDANRVEYWRGDRLVGFSGITTINGETTKVQGAAEGDHFVVSSPKGRVVAPANICPSNPWSSNFLHHNVMLGTDDGTIEHVRIVDGGEVSIEVRGKPVLARIYDILGKWRDQVWLDGKGVPVRFSDDGRGAHVVFTLIRLVDRGE